MRLVVGEISFAGVFFMFVMIQIVEVFPIPAPFDPIILACRDTVLVLNCDVDPPKGEEEV